MSINRRDFLQAGASGGAFLLLTPKIKASSAAFDIEEKTVMELQSAMKTGEVTSRKLVEIYLKRIREIDGKINSLIELNPDALAIADRMDKERAGGKVRSQMHGIPVVIKDNIDTADKMKTTAGSLALVDAPTPKQDAFIVKQMRKAGAVLLGKTNLSGRIRPWRLARSPRRKLFAPLGPLYPDYGRSE